jgi:hypothetical protein
MATARHNTSIDRRGLLLKGAAFAGAAVLPTLPAHGQRPKSDASAQLAQAGRAAPPKLDPAVECAPGAGRDQAADLAVCRAK